MKLLKMLILPAKASVIVSAFAAFGALELSANTEVTWIGGASGSFHTASNWDPAVVPSGEKSAAYVAVFTNSASLTGSDWWYPAGLKVRGNSTVTLDLGTYRFMPSKVSEDGWIVFDVETGSSFELTTTSNIYGSELSSFKKTGGGTVRMSGSVVVNDGMCFKTLDIAEGMLDMPGVGVMNGITVRSGATLAVRNESGISRGNYPPYVITVEEGATLDCGGKRHWIGSLAGAGEVTNTGLGLYLNLGVSGATFFGKIHGKLIVAPAASVTPQGSYVVIGTRDMLADADFTYTPAAGVETSVRFAPNIGIFLAKSYPAETFYDTDGKPVEFCSQLIYVDAAQTVSGDGTSWETAYRTLAEAFATPPVEYAKVLVKPGTYDEGAMLVSATDAVSNRVVVSKNVTVQSTGSAADTFIVGAPSPTPLNADTGFGPNATRCVYLKSGASVRGFTIRDGRTTKSVNGGGVYMVDTTCRTVDCVLTNNVAARGGAGSGGSYVRCRIVGNKSTENLGHGIIYTVKAYNCFFDSNGSGSTGHYVAGNPAEFHSCTFGPNDGTLDARTVAAQPAKSCQAYNSIFMLTFAGNDGICDLHNCLVLAGTNKFAYADAATFVTNIAAKADRLAYAGLDADLRAGPDGAAFDGGDETLYAVPSGEDAGLDGDRQKRISNGCLDIGASEFDAESSYVTVAVPVHEGFTVTGVTPGQIVRVAPGETLTYTLNRTLTSEKLCTGFRVNGQYHSFDDYPDGFTHTVTGAGYQLSETVEAVFNEQQKDWYVDPVNGDDESRGYHAKCAFKTLTNALARAQSGDTVHAAAGFYTNSLMTVGAADATTNRVVLEIGVTLQATEGPEKTFILGQGKDANLRCVYLKKNASIRGFTLANGRASDYGGGVWATDKTCVIADCIISNNVATRGGGCYRGTYSGCRILANSAAIGSAIYLGCDLQDCLIDRNDGSTTCYIAGNPSTLVNCTFGPNEDGNLRAATNTSGQATHVYDSLFLAKPVGDACGIVFHNCRLMAGNATGLACEDGTQVTNVADKAERLAAAGVDPDTLRPLVDSPLVDVGRWADRFEVDVPAQDAAGGQRVYHCTVDIGGLEHDWRGDFARRLAASPALAVTAASENVTLGEPDGVRVDAGETLACRWTNPRGTEKDYTLSVAMTGSGTLVCRLNGQELARVTEADGKKELAFTNTATANDLTFVLEGEGSAVVSDLTRRGTSGLTVIVR